MLGFANNAFSQLVSDITTSQTVVNVLPSDGAKFAQALVAPYINPLLSLQVIAKVTISDTDGNNEICHLTNVTGDALTVVRAQDGTTARAWTANSSIGNLVVAGSDGRFIQIDQLQTGYYLASNGGASPNTLVANLPGVFTGAESWDLKAPLVLYPTTNNTNSVTLQINFNNISSPVLPLINPAGTNLKINDLQANMPYLIVAKSDKSAFVLTNPSSLYNNYLPLTGGEITGDLTVDNVLNVKNLISGVNGITLNAINNDSTTGVMMQGRTTTENDPSGYFSRTFNNNYTLSSVTNGQIIKDILTYSNNSDTFNFNVSSLDLNNISLTSIMFASDNGYFSIPVFKNIGPDSPEKFILQWGIGRNTGEVSYPIPFPAKLVTLVISDRDGHAIAGTNSSNLESFIVDSTTSALAYFWFAAGY